MMKQFLVTGIFVALLASPVVAQSGGQQSDQSDEIAQGRAMVRAAIDEIIRSELQLTEAEAADFWPLYEEYRGKTDQVMDRLGDLIAEYLRRYDAADLTNEYADELVKNHIQIRKDLLAIQERSLPLFGKVIPALKVARFYQLENKINADIDIQLALAIPLVDPT